MENRLDTLRGLPLYLSVAREISRDSQSSTLSILLRMVLCRALYGLGARDYALFRLDSKAMSSVSQFRTKRQTTAAFVRINPKQERWRVDDKRAFWRLCVEAGIPTPQVLVLLSRRELVDPGTPVVRDFQAVLDFFRQEENIALIIKPVDDGRGNGVRFVRLKRGVPYDSEDRPIDIAGFDADLQSDLGKRDQMVQRFLEPDPVIAGLGNGKAMGTLRVLTSCLDGKFALHYALARIPCGTNMHDNFTGGSGGNLIAWIDPESGVIGPGFGRRRDPDSWTLESFARNPDTGNPIQGVVVPRWPEVKALLRTASQHFHQIPILGWDVAMARDGIYLLEANSNADIMGAQATSPHGAAALLPVLALRS